MPDERAGGRRHHRWWTSYSDTPRPTGPEIGGSFCSEVRCAVKISLVGQRTQKWPAVALVSGYSSFGSLSKVEEAWEVVGLLIICAALDLLEHHLPVAPLHSEHVVAHVNDEAVAVRLLLLSL
jgi:hypothetical protein